MKNKTNKTQKPGYLVFGAIVIALVAILLIYFVMIMLGLVQVSKNHIVITTESADKMYDGESLTTDEDSWEIVEGALLSGHRIEAKVIGSQTEPGESDNIIAVTIYDSAGADVTNTYEIEYHLGKLAVHGKRLEFYSGSAQKYYDGEPLHCDEWGFIEKNSEELLPGHVYTAYCSGQLTNIDQIDNELKVTITDKATGKDVTSYYDIVVHTGTLTVAPRRLVVSFNVEGDVGSEGGDINTRGVLISGNTLEGHEVKWEPIGTDIAGISIDTIFVYVVDENGNDVTEYYEIVYPVGDLTLQNPETFFPNIPENLYDINQYRDIFDSLDEEKKKELMALLGDTSSLEGLPPEVAALALMPIYKVVSNTSGTVYLRLQSYGDFDGNDWSDPPVHNGVTPYLYSQAALSANNLPKSQMRIKPLFDGLNYILPYYYQSGDYSINDYNDCFNLVVPEVDKYYNTTYIPYQYSYGNKYTVPSTLDSSFSSYSAYVYNNYLNIDEELKAELLRLASKYDTNPNMDGIQPLCTSNGRVLVSDVIGQVAAYIQGVATYDLSSFSNPDGDIIHFMTVSKKGVSQHFAAAATLLYRSLGIPARYVRGFATNAVAGEETVITALMERHWVEVFLDGFGWVQIDVTPAADGSGEGDGGSPGIGSSMEGSGSSENGDKSIFWIYPDDPDDKGTLYIREKSYGDFNNITGEWEKAKSLYIYDVIDPFTIANYALSGSGAGESRKLYISMLISNYPYMLPYYATEYQYTQKHDTHVEGTYRVDEKYQIGYTYYDYIAMGGNIKVTNAYSNIESGYAKMVAEQYLSVDARTLNGYTTSDGKHYKGINDIIDEQGWRNITDQYQLIKAVKEYVQNAAEYSLNFPKTPDGEDKVLFFLNDSKIGKCSHYATAGTLIFRALGIPARYTVGYKTTLSDTITYVKGSNAHAWVEVYVQGAGWVNIEVTGTARQTQGNNNQPQRFSITVPTPSYEKYYDKTPLTVPDNAQVVWAQFKGNGWTSSVENGRIKWTCHNAGQEGHWFYQDQVNVIDGLSITEISGDVLTKVTASMTIRDSSGNDVTARYNFNFTGTMEVKPIEVYVLSGSKHVEGMADGGIYNDTVTVTKVIGTIDGKLLDEGDGIVAEFFYNSSNTFNHYGIVDNEFDAVMKRGDELLRYYVIIPTFGKLEIT